MPSLVTSGWRYAPPALLLSLLLWSPSAGDNAAGAAGGTGEEEVRLDGYYIDRYEFPNVEGALPRVGVTWSEALALCQKRGKRLCTELEWEQACAGPERLAYGYAQEFAAGQCNTPQPGPEGWRRGPGLAPSGSYPACGNQNGVRDLIGNAWEWTDGWYDRARGWRVVRGGSWFNSANMARSSSRYGRFLTETYALDLVGFRCCRSAATGQEPPPERDEGR